MPSVPTPSKAGIIESGSGDRHIPSSLRSDGTQRKEIKIRPGYKPPEDVEVYKNRAANAFQTRGSRGVPGAEGLKDDKEPASASSNKNAKRREARKKTKAGAEADAAPASPEETGALDVFAKVSGGEGSKLEDWRVRRENDNKSAEEVDPEAAKDKKARNLKKKLKQARELQEKKEGGSALLPEQFAKVIKINELIRELAALGIDPDDEVQVEAAKDPKREEHQLVMP